MATRSRATAPGDRSVRSRDRPARPDDDPDFSHAPPHGLSVPCHIRAVITVDHVIADLSGGVEIDLFLLGLRPPAAGEPTDFGFRLRPDAVGMREWVARRVDSHGGRGVAWIPLPCHDRGWLRNLHPGSRHAGVLFLGREGRDNLNAAIAAASLCPVDRACPYLHPDFAASPDAAKIPTTLRAA